ncbi:MAG: cell division protein ZapE, partial [Actinobacteria bacterium]|nr:cell division protein ZapE [Actinomycetota bacterium]
MTDQAASSGVVHLIDRQPQMSGTELLSGLVPPPQFDGATFESYRSDSAYPSQEDAKQQLVVFATGAQPAKRGGL